MSDLSLPPYARLGKLPLVDHFHKCLLSSGPLHRIYCAGEVVHGFLARRFVTTVLVVAVFISLW